jgi:hypothetical protein
MARGWSPRGTKSETSFKGPDIETRFIHQVDAERKDIGLPEVIGVSRAKAPFAVALAITARARRSIGNIAVYLE